MSTLRCWLPFLPFFAIIALGGSMLGGCVTSGDLRQLSDRVRVQGEEGVDRTTAFAESLDGLADELDERTALAKEGLTKLTEGGILGIVGAIGVAVKGTMVLRDRARRRRNEVVGGQLARPTPPTAPPVA